MHSGSKGTTSRDTMLTDLDTPKRIICEAITTHVDEITCADCFDQLDRFAELVLQGRNAELEMPYVHDHLEHCRDCRQEFDALMLALVAMLPPEA